MNLEIEKKFLVKGDFREDVFESVEITQAYICSGHGHTVRVRSWGDKGYLTIKGPSNESGAARMEWEREIPVDDVVELCMLAEPGIIQKTRHLARNTDGVHTWEIDEFHGDNDGLVIAEIELADENEAFDKPDWLGEEVTGDGRYYNSVLRKNPYKNWK